jgi:hypothetical protein
LPGEPGVLVNDQDEYEGRYDQRQIPRRPPKFPQ